METTTRITTQNPTWGFFGTLTAAGAADTGALFDATARELMARLDLTAEEARKVLDDKIGRHIADQHRAGETAETLVARLLAQGWKRDILRAAGRAPKATKASLLRISHDELPMLRFALEHAKSSISDAHPEDHAQLDALIARLGEAERKAAR